MRNIGNLEKESSVRLFSDALFAKNIEHQIDPDEEHGGWSLWIVREEQIKEAKALLLRFRENPDSSEFHEATQVVDQARKELKKRAERARARYVDVRTTWHNVATRRIGPLTLGLIGISVGVAVLTQLGQQEEYMKSLTITQYQRADNVIRWFPWLPEICQGQVWRLLTPMFIHFSLLHLLFNMLWLKDLGTMIENRHGKLRLLILVLVISALSNLGQYIASGPLFGGMSGVVYGLLGFIWIRGKFDPASGYYLDRWIVMMMTFWFVACLVGIIPNIANTAHGVGLGLGMAWGLVSSGKLGLFGGRRGHSR